VKRSSFFDHVALSRERILNHPGHRDQKSHGRKGGDGFKRDKQVKAAYEFKDAKSGLTAKVTEIDHAGGFSGMAGRIEVEIKIYDRTGAEVGQASRTIVRPNGDEPGYVIHQDLELQPGVQGTGFGSRFNAHAEEVYREQGMDRIELGANVDVGGYAWARAGYDFQPVGEDGIDTRSFVAQRAREKAGGYDDATGQEIERVASKPDAAPIEFAMIGHTPGATTWPGKEIMLGSSWSGVKKL
jgi:GNAT superfamily N-acetyltransferase